MLIFCQRRSETLVRPPNCSYNKLKYEVKPVWPCHKHCLCFELMNNHVHIHLNHSKVKRAKPAETQGQIWFNHSANVVNEYYSHWGMPFHDCHQYWGFALATNNPLTRLPLRHAIKVSRWLQFVPFCVTPRYHTGMQVWGAPKDELQGLECSMGAPSAKLQTTQKSRNFCESENITVGSFKLNVDALE